MHFFLDVDREELARRIDARFDAMLAERRVAEVERLAARGLNPMLPAMKAHGVPWLIRHLRGEIGLDEAAEGGKRDTKRYTKRQATWFRNQMPDWPWLEAGGDLGESDGMGENRLDRGADLPYKPRKEMSIRTWSHVI